MIKYVREIVLVTSLGFLFGCAVPTMYQPLTDDQGYQSIQLSDNVWQVSFKGNAVTDIERVRDLGMLHAAEVGLQNGFNYFAIKDDQNQEKVRESSGGAMYMGAWGCGFGPCGGIGYGDNVRMSRHRVERVVVYFKDKPKDVITYDGRLVQTEVKAAYGI